MTDRRYVTTPIFYVNGSPHVGHAYTSIAADVLARWHRSAGRDVHFLTGTDEHGQKVEKAAAERALSPGAFADLVSAEFRAMAVRLDISFDDFIRTTEARHEAACLAFWRRLEAAGQIYRGEYEGWYSVRDEAFFGEDELTVLSDGSRIAPGGAPVERVREASYFFRLSQWGEKLLALYADEPGFIAPSARRNEIESFVRSGLADLSISRTSFSWGVPVPGDPDHVMYVWIDALVNYLSALGWPEDGKLMRFWPADLHLVGKEIARFHAVYWPALLMAAGIAPPRRVFSHGWWTVDGEKISKSVGNVIDPNVLVDEFGVDAVRFFLLREVPFGRDGDFNRAALIRRLNTELANDLGNLAQRTLSLVAKNLDGVRPAPIVHPTEDDRSLLDAAASLPSLLDPMLERQAFADALEEIWRVIRAANAYIDRQAPWALRRTDPARMTEVLRALLDTLRTVATTLAPFMPSAMSRLLAQLGVDAGHGRLIDLGTVLEGGASLPAPSGIFPRHVEQVATAC